MLHTQAMHTVTRGVLESPIPPKDRPQQVVKHNKNAPHAADADVGTGLLIGLLGRVEQTGQCSGPTDQKSRKENSQRRKEQNTRSDGPARLLAPPLSDLLAHKDGDSHGQPGDHHGHRLHQHTAGGDA